MKRISQALSLGKIEKPDRAPCIVPSHSLTVVRSGNNAVAQMFPPNQWLNFAIEFRIAQSEQVASRRVFLCSRTRSYIPCVQVHAIELSFPLFLPIRLFYNAYPCPRSLFFYFFTDQIFLYSGKLSEIERWVVIARKFDVQIISFDTFVCLEC